MNSQTPTYHRLGKPRPSSLQRAAGHKGFTLVEVLIAFGVFAIGMIAVASLFPVAALLQKETADDILGKQAADSARSIVLAKPLEYTPSAAGGSGELSGYYGYASNVNENRALPLFEVAPTGVNFYEKYTFFDRSFPSFNPQLLDRDFIWLPFIQDANGDSADPLWVMHLFILKRDSRADYDKSTGSWANPSDGNAIPGVAVIGTTVTGPDVFNLAGAHQIEIGDQIMHSTGVAYRVIDVDGNDITISGAILESPNPNQFIYHAPPGTGGDGNSPTLQIVTFTSDPTNPDSLPLVIDPTAP